jgi:hypothetical protein
LEETIRGTTRSKRVESSEFRLNLKILTNFQVAVEKMDCGRIGLLGVRDIAMGFGLVVRIRGNHEERDSEVQLCPKQPKPERVVFMAQLRRHVL